MNVSKSVRFRGPKRHLTDDFQSKMALNTSPITPPSFLFEEDDDVRQYGDRQQPATTVAQTTSVFTSNPATNAVKECLDFDSRDDDQDVSMSSVNVTSKSGQNNNMTSLDLDSFLDISDVDEKMDAENDDECERLKRRRIEAGEKFAQARVPDDRETDRLMEKMKSCRL